MRIRRSILFSAAALLPVSIALGSKDGVVAGKNSMPSNLTTGFPSCGNCHTSTPNSGVRVEISGASSVAPGASVAMKVAVSDPSTNTQGGFALEASAGAYVAGTGTRVDTTVRGAPAITHANPLSRTWSFSWTAPTTPGLVTMTATGNAANGDGKDRGDEWGFYGHDSTIPGAMYRVFVNAPGITSTGEGCTGTDGYRPVLGMAKPPQIGTTWNSEAYNLPPATASVGILGLSNTTFGVLPLPFPLKPIGGGDCVLRVSLDVMQVTVASGRGSGNGSAQIAWILPNDANLRGIKLYFQQMTVDAKANTFGFSFSNALTTTIQ
ncbi:MAG: hypothetical protein H6832_01415 [Planctomycetes bacterium]|nr:hypothetical protein [Planctomycetota bacterium]MCB9917044.1 hypothetical protein [Planctomycetota bacterium]